MSRQAIETRELDKLPKADTEPQNLVGHWIRVDGKGVCCVLAFHKETNLDYNNMKESFEQIIDDIETELKLSWTHWRAPQLCTKINLDPPKDSPKLH